MKTLLILRHGKAQPDAPKGDHARVLTNRGQRNASDIGEYIATHVPPIDAIVTSDAARAYETAELAGQAISFSTPLTVEPRIYAAELATLLDIVHALPNDAERVLLVGHNPGFEELSEVLAAAGVVPGRLPTAALAHLDFDVAHWRDVREGTGLLRGVITPRSLAGEA